MLRKDCLTENFIYEAAVLLCKDLTAQTRRKHNYPKGLSHGGFWHHAWSLLIIVCSIKFVDEGFQFKDLHYKLQTVNLKLKKGRRTCDSPFFL